MLQTINVNLKYSHSMIPVIVLIITIILGMAVFMLKEWLVDEPSAVNAPVNINFLNVFEEEDVYSEFIQTFQRQNSNVNINYQKIDHLEYREKLLQAFAGGKPPDIFAIHNTWLPMFESKIKPAPQEPDLMQSFSDKFPSVVEFDFARKTSDGKLTVYAIPLGIENLVLFYNKDMLKAEGLENPPATWEEVTNYTRILTKYDDSRKITHSGIALGSADNINRSQDIVALLMMQKGALMNNRELTKATFDESLTLQGNNAMHPANDALEFYLSFSDKTKGSYSWDEDMVYSIDAFVWETAAMMINYPHHISTIKSKAPYLNFGIAPIPQFRDQEKSVNYPYYFGLALGKSGDSMKENIAWEFLQFLNQTENLKKYLNKTNLPTARLDLILWQQQNPEIAYFSTQILNSKSWSQGDSLEVKNIFENMIKSGASGEEDLSAVINDSAKSVTEVITEVRSKHGPVTFNPDHSLR